MDYFNHLTQELEPQIDVGKVLKRNEELEEDGFYVILYRQGSRPPMWLTHQHEDKGE